MAAKYSKESLDSFCEKIISKECLLKTINSANKLTSEYGHSCIVTLLNEVKCFKVIPRIAEELSSKNPILRQKVSEYILIIISSFDRHIIEKYQTILEGALTTALGDANKDVRQTTRKAFQLYIQLFPQQTHKLLNTLDLPVQKALVDEGIIDSSMSTFRKVIQHTGTTQTNHSRPSTAVISRASSQKEELTKEKPEYFKSNSTSYSASGPKLEEENAPKKKNRDLRSITIVKNASQADKSPSLTPKVSYVSSKVQFQSLFEPKAEVIENTTTKRPVRSSTLRERDTSVPISTKQRSITPVRKHSPSPLSLVSEDYER